MSSPYHEALKDFVKAFPGTKWDKPNKVWLVPVEIVQTVCDWIVDNTTYLPEIEESRLELRLEPARLKVSELHPYQVTGVEFIQNNRRGFLFFETGLGKSITALECLNRHQRIVIVTKASLRYQWRDEVTQWYGRQSICIIEDGAQATTVDPHAYRYYIISYELVPKLQFLPDAIIFDEAHYLANPVSKRSMACQQLASKATYVVGLTATPIMTEIQGLYGMLQTVFPDRFGVGKGWDFRKRYCEFDQNNPYSDWSVIGAREDTLPELQSRLAAVSVRATKEEWGHLLPPIQVTAVRHLPPKRDVLALHWSDNSRQLHDEEHREFLKLSMPWKVSMAIDQAKGHRDADRHARIFVITFFKATARQIAEGLPGALHIDGEASQKERKACLETAKTTPGTVVVATMGSIVEGLNLGWADVVVIAEIDWRPGAITQVLGRFSRLGDQHSTLVECLVLEATLDELKIETVRERINTINKVIKAGTSEKALQGVLELTEDEQEAALLKLAEIAERREDFDEYI